MVDEFRVRRVLTHIENNLPLWNQKTWKSQNDCGTAYCFAGWAVVLEGIEIESTHPLAVYVRKSGLTPEWRQRIQGRNLGYLDGDNDRIAVSDMAALILDLRPDQKWELFGACFDLPYLRRAIDWMCPAAPALPA